MKVNRARRRQRQRQKKSGSEGGQPVENPGKDKWAFLDDAGKTFMTSSVSSLSVQPAASTHDDDDDPTDNGGQWSMERLPRTSIVVAPSEGEFFPP